MGWNAMLAAILVFSACEGKNTAPGPAPLIPKTPRTTRASAGPSPADASIFPLAFLTLKTKNGESHCMGGYFGEGKILTAGHCLAGLTEDDCAGGNLAVTWATKQQGGAESPGKATSCATFRAPTSTASQSDLGVVFLAANAIRPEESLHFADALPAEVARLFIWGPPGEMGFFAIAVGGIFARSSEFVSHNAPVEPGFSGSPVLGIPDATTAKTVAEVLPESLNLGVIGIHLGYVGGVLTAVSASVARAFLDAAQVP